MATRRNALGRGLGALIPPRPEAPASDLREPAGEAGPSTPQGDAGPGEGARLDLDVTRIAPNPQQPRREFDDEELGRLAASIQQHGVLQPVVVRRTGGEGAERYELVVGERRWRASRMAGAERIPAVVTDLADRELLEVALVENVQREDLNPIELALAFQTLAEGGATQDEIGRRVGLDRSSVANHLRLLDLPRDFQRDVEEGRLSFGHAKALLAVSNPERRRHLRKRIVDEGLSVRETERLGRGPGAPARKRRAAPAASSDPEQQRILDLLRERLKTRVRIAGGASGRGRIEIEFFGPEDLGRIASAILDG